MEKFLNHARLLHKDAARKLLSGLAAIPHEDRPAAAADITDTDVLPEFAE